MRITAAIPCYNAERFIGGCLESLIAQSRPPDEIIVVDDGSSDRTAEILSSHRDVKVITLKQNRGVAHARNVLINNASGEVIVFIDADAIADLNLVQELGGAYEAGVAGVGGRAIEQNGDSLADRWRRLHASQGYGNEHKSNVAFLWGVCSSYLRDVLLEAGGFDERFRTNGEDTEMGFRLESMGKRLDYNPKAIVHHQRTDTIISLCKMMFRWYYWGYIAMRKVRGAAFSFYIKTCIKVLLRNIYTDLVQEKSPRLAFVSVLMSRVELLATLKAALTARRVLKQRP